MIPGEIIHPAGAPYLEANTGLDSLTLIVANKGDRPIQVGSHFHFYEVNTSLDFPRESARGFRLNIPAGFNAVKGKQYSLANGTFIYPGIFYNPDVFEAAGVGVPTTFDELVDTAKAIKANGKTPFLLSSGSDTWSSEFLLNGLISADVLGRAKGRPSQLL